jgi:predicted transcriptional regulator
MAKALRISEAEARVMEVLWERSPLSASEVIEALAAASGWNHRTIRTLLSRLAAKGAVKVTAQGRAYLYRPALSRERFVREESRGFLERVFGGSPLAAVVHLVEEEPLSPEELVRLRRVLEAKGKKP